MFLSLQRSALLESRGLETGCWMLKLATMGTALLVAVSITAMRSTVLFMLTAISLAVPYRPCDPAFPMVGEALIVAVAKVATHLSTNPALSHAYCISRHRCNGPSLCKALKRW